METTNALLGIICCLLALFVPWAWAVHGRLSKIETVISNGMKERMKELVDASKLVQDRLGKLETQVAVHFSLTQPKLFPPDGEW